MVEIIYDLTEIQTTGGAPMCNNVCNIQEAQFVPLYQIFVGSNMYFQGQGVAS